MQNVMSGIQANHVLDTFLTALGVNSDSLEVLAGCARQQSQIRPAKYAEILQCLIGVGFLVPEALGPLVLVIAGQLRAVMRQDHTKPITPDELRIRQMLQAMADRPFPWSLGLRDLLSG